MIRKLVFSSVLALAAAGTVFGAQGAPAGSVPRTPAARIPVNPGPPARLVNPASPAARLMLATPAQRQRALEKLPPEQQERIRKQLEWFDALPKAQQDLQIRRLQLFASLPPEKRLVIREQMKVFAAMPPDRKAQVRRAWQMLESLPPAQRERRMNSDAFRSRFSTDEQKLIADLCEAWLPPL